MKAPNPGSDDYYGAAFALSDDGSTLAIGAFFEDSAATGIGGDQQNKTASGAGAVYVYVRAGATWTLQAYVKASNAEAVDGFGAAVALSADGSTLAVGAPFEDSAATGIGGVQNDANAFNAGAAYVFRRMGTVWQQQAYVKASNTDSDDIYGASVALSADGNTLAVGASQEASGNPLDPADNSVSSAGAVYVYRFTSTWAFEAYLKSSSPGASDGMGAFGTLALSATGNTLAAGSPGEVAGTGGVYVFERSGQTWSAPLHLTATNPDLGDAFGQSVVLSGDGNTLIVGAPSEDGSATGIDGNQNDNTGGDTGAVYAFARSGATWMPTAYIKASNTNGADAFGTYLALSADGTTVAVGAVGEDGAGRALDGDEQDNSSLDSGAVYVFTRTTASWKQAAYVKATNTGGNDHLGWCVALSHTGATLVAGAPEEDGSGSGISPPDDDNLMTAGAAYVIE